MSDTDSSALRLAGATYRHPAPTSDGGDEGVSRGVEDVSLSVAAGEVLGLLGPNGSGKSTVLSLVAGFLQPQSGVVEVLGAPVSAAASPAVRRRLGVVFQDASIDPMMTVGETLRLHGRLFGLGGARLRGQIDVLLARMGLSDRAGDRVETLSGGLRRRVELARAVLHEPALLLLDEPSLGLDPDSRSALWDLLDGVRAEGAAMLLATNDVGEAERACDRVAFLQAGRVVTTGTPSDLRRALRHDSVRVEWRTAPADVESRLAAMTGVGAVRTARLADGGMTLHVTVDDASAFVPALFALAGSNGSNGPGGIAGIRIRESTLEDAYFQQVGVPLQGEPLLGEPLQGSTEAAAAANGRPS